MLVFLFVDAVDLQKPPLSTNETVFHVIVVFRPLSAIQYLARDSDYLCVIILCRGQMDVCLFARIFWCIVPCRLVPAFNAFSSHLIKNCFSRVINAVGHDPCTMLWNSQDEGSVPSDLMTCLVEN